MNYSTLCPPGFVSNAVQRHLLSLDPSSCLISCYENPYYKSMEWSDFNNQIQGFTISGIVLTIILLCTYLGNRKLRNNYLVLCVSIIFAFSAIISLVQSTKPFKSRFCSSEFRWIDSSSGINACSLQSFSHQYALHVGYIYWTVQALDVFIKICLQIRNTEDYIGLYFILVFGLPFSSIIYIALTGSFGFVEIYSMCFIDIDKNIDIIAIYFPMIACLCIGISLLGCTFLKITRNTSKITRRRPRIQETLRVFQSSLYFLFSFFLIYILLIIDRSILYDYQHDIKDKYDEWKRCILNNGASSLNPEELCGSHPSGRFSKNLVTMFLFLVIGQSILFSCVHLCTRNVFLTWIRFLPCARSYLTGSEIVSSRFWPEVSFTMKKLENRRSQAGSNAPKKSLVESNNGSLRRINSRIGSVANEPSMRMRRGSKVLSKNDRVLSVSVRQASLVNSALNMENTCDD